MTLRVCPEPGCPELTASGPCARHQRRSLPTSSRNHRGVPRQARGHGADHERAVRTFRAERRACQLRLPGCTGLATSSDYSSPGDWTSRRRPACLHCQRAQGGRITSSARRIMAAAR